MSKREHDKTESDGAFDWEDEERNLSLGFDLSELRLGDVVIIGGRARQIISWGARAPIAIVRGSEYTIMAVGLV